MLLIETQQSLSFEAIAEAMVLQYPDFRGAPPLAGRDSPGQGKGHTSKGRRASALLRRLHLLHPRRALPRVHGTAKVVSIRFLQPMQRMPHLRLMLKRMASFWTPSMKSKSWN